jgi:hypothetical protein
MEWGIFWAAQLALFIFIPLMVIWLFAIVDLFGRADIGGFGKALWLLAILFLPILGTLSYYVSRPLETPSSPGAGSSREAALADMDASPVVRSEQYEMQRAFPGTSLAGVEPRRRLRALAHRLVVHVPRAPERAR